MRFALERWCFLLGHLGFTATQTALPMIVTNNIIIINKIPQCSDFRCRLTSCCTAQAGIWRTACPKSTRGERTMSLGAQHPALLRAEAAVTPQISFFLLGNDLGQQLTALLPGAKLHLPLTMGQRVINAFVHRYTWLGELTLF